MYYRSDSCIIVSMKLYTKFIRLLFAALTIATVSLPVHAIEGESIVLSPGSEAMSVKAGESYSNKFVIINDGTNAYTFRVYAAPYSVDGTNYTPNFEEGRAANADLYKWITLEKSRYDIKPGEKVEVPYTVKTPSDATPGGHYGVIFAETQVDESQQSQIGRQKRVGMIVYGTVDGQYLSAGKQLESRIDWLQIGGELATSMTVENTGNVHYSMKHALRIKNVLGQTVYDNTTDRIIMPKTTRDITDKWSKGATMGVYSVTTESTILDKVTTQTSWVVLVPSWFVIVAVIVIVAFIVLAVRARRR